MNKELVKISAISTKNLINNLIEHSLNDNKVSHEKIKNLLAEYEKNKLELESFEQNLDDEFLKDIKTHRMDKNMAIEDYLTQRTSLYDEWKDKNSHDSLRNLLQFQIKTLPHIKKINEDLKYEHIYTKYANIRMLL